MNYYNEFDSGAAAWLKELIAAGCIPPGIVDTRSIVEVTPNDVAGFTQCHFFAGIGGWSLALALAGWSPKESVWTGSCPCQPFSVAGKGLGTEDERHLWPHFRRLIADCNPSRVFGEQVASKDGRVWLDGVRADLEALAYGVGSADLCAAGVGAPHIRQRLYWVADSQHQQREGSLCGRHQKLSTHSSGKTSQSTGCGAHSEYYGNGGVADSQQQGPQGSACQQGDTGRVQGTIGRMCGAGSSGLVYPNGAGCGEQRGTVAVEQEQFSAQLSGSDSWGNHTWIPCADGKARRIEPSITPLVNGFPGRVGLIRGYGNAICVPLAAEFIAACMEVLGVRMAA